MAFQGVNQVFADIWDALTHAIRVTSPLHTSGGQGQKNVAAAGTAERLAAASTPCTSVVMSARIGNTKQVAYGFGNAVKATANAEVGATLQPGDSVVLNMHNLQDIWLDAQVSGEGVSYSYTTD